MFAFLRRLLIGAPLHSSRQLHERLPKILGLPVFASDAVSSVAYATEEILFVLMVAGAVAWYTSLWVTAAIVVLISIVATSYRQTIFAYPQGGGSYTVAKENLGILPGLVAAASLLTDYVLTVSVSIAAGVAAIVSMHQAWAPYTELMGIGAVFLVAFLNLRGLRESGALFAPPTYAFIISLAVLIIVGMYKVITGTVEPVVSHPLGYAKEVYEAKGLHWNGLQSLGLLLILRGFSSGCAALTGIEAIANGIPAFKPPESKNAAATLTYMAIILATLVCGISMLAYFYHAYPSENETLISSIAAAIFGRGTFSFYYIIQVATAAILILAANTAFQDFPRLSSILARDRFAPRQLASVGDKLVFSNGIVLLSLVAALLIAIFKGDTTRLIPLYAVGVFISFTLSQIGMGVRQRRLKHPGWRLHSAISYFGGTVTGIVALVIAITKFVHGAFIVILVIPAMVWIFYKIHQHYIELGDQLRLTPENFVEPPPVRSTAIVLTSGVHKGILPALEYARTLSHDYRALFIEIDPVETALIRDRWEQFGLGVPLVILESPYRSILQPVLKYLEEAKKERPNHIVTVVLPEFVPRKWWHKLLHTQSGFFIKIMLMFRRDIVVTNVRYYLEK
ncbi:MAG: APC family permease [Armatimonadetes bacterium]|nr:APC family permease [Armatimonadota bacterium]